MYTYAYIYIYIYNIICTFHAIEGIPIEKDEQKQKRKGRVRNERMTQIEKGCRNKFAYGKLLAIEYKPK